MQRIEVKLKGVDKNLRQILKQHEVVLRETGYLRIYLTDLNHTVIRLLNCWTTKIAFMEEFTGGVKGDVTFGIFKYGDVEVEIRDDRDGKYTLSMEAEYQHELIEIRNKVISGESLKII